MSHPPSKPITLQPLIIAGGKSSRMGQDKACQTLGGQSNFARILQTCVSVRAILKAVLVRGHYKTRPPAEHPFDMIINEHSEKGRMGTIQRGIRARQSSHYLLWPVDIPFVKESTVQALWRECQRDPGAYDLWIPSIHKRRGHPIIFTEDLAQDILKQGPDHPLRALFQGRRIRHVTVEDEAILWDLNTAEKAQEGLERFHR